MFLPVRFEQIHLRLLGLFKLDHFSDGDKYAVVLGIVNSDEDVCFETGRDVHTL